MRVCVWFVWLVSVCVCGLRFVYVVCGSWWWCVCARLEFQKRNINEIILLWYCAVEEWKGFEESRPTLKEKWIFVVKKSEETKHRTEWRVQKRKIIGVRDVEEAVST